MRPALESFHGEYHVMSSRVLLLAFALLEAILIFACVNWKAPKIENELTTAATEALAANDIVLGDGLVVDGRDAWLTGRAPTPAAKKQAERTIASVRGIRVVHNLLTVHGDGGAVQPASPSMDPAGLQQSIDELIAGRIVEFETGSNRLTERGQALVDEIAALLGRFPGVRVEIAGHTDSQGTSRNNFELSQRRAEAVKARLVTQGVEESRLTAVGYGEDRPIADNDTAAGRLQNRRVELTVLP